MSPVSNAAVFARRVLVKRPWIYWVAVTLAATGSAASMLEHSDRVEAARDSWGATRSVWIAAVDHSPGDPLEVERREVPVAFIEGDAVERFDGDAARQHIGKGEVIHRSDVAASGGPQSMTPRGWLVVPILESPPSGALVGDRAQAVAEGLVVGSDVLVVGHHHDVTLIAAPADVAPLLPMAADAGRLTLLLVP